jgi:hypothetical protein
MKTTLFNLTTCMVMLAGPAMARPDAVASHTELVNKVKEAERAFQDARPFKSYFVDIKSQLPTFSDAEQAKREKLERAIDDLLERAQNAQLILEDFWRIQAMIIDAKVCAEIRVLWKQAKSREATRTQFEYVAGLLRERADAAKEHPDLRQMVQDEMDKLMKRYLGGATPTDIELALVDDETARSLLDRGLEWLEKMAIKRQATREQFLFVKDLMMYRARNFSEDVEWRGLMERVNAELDRLMNADLHTASFSRDDFLKLREMCMRKAREVMTGKVPG